MKINNEVYVIGVYPLPYGGATVKCKLFCKMLNCLNIIANRINVYDVNRNILKSISVLKNCINDLLIRLY